MSWFLVDLGEETVSSRQLLFGGILEVRKASLHDQFVLRGGAAIVSGRGTTEPPDVE